MEKPRFATHIWAGFVTAFFAGLSFLTIVLGQVAIMVYHLREPMLQEIRHLNAMIEDLKRDGASTPTSDKADLPE